MDGIKNIAIGTVVTLLIGGTTYTLNQGDIIQNFADDTGMSTEQAEQYVNDIPEEELVSFEELGNGHLEMGQDVLNSAREIDCVNYEYEWESVSLTCLDGKAQLEKFALDNNSLGYAYKKLESDSASEDDISNTIRLIDRLNSDYEFEIITSILDWYIIDEGIKTNLYNKAILKTALESD